MDNNVNSKHLLPHELSNFFEILAMFQKNGISTWESLSIMSENTTDRNFIKMVDGISEKVSNGSTLSSALKDSGKFPEYAISMIEIGENTGRLEETVESLCQYYDSRDDLIKNIRTSVAYPIFMAAMVLIVVFVLIVQIMPVFQQVFAQLGIIMNPLSLALLDIGQALNQYAFGALLVATLIALIVFAISKTKKGKKALTKFFETSPLTRGLAQAESANRFAFSMSLMLNSGVDTISAFDFASQLIDSPVASAKIKKIRNNLISGSSLSDAIIDGEIFENSYNGILSAGIKYGSAGEVLMNISARYKKEAEERTAKLLSIIEPTLVAILCIMVGIVMLSVMLPLTGILSSM